MSVWTSICTFPALFTLLAFVIGLSILVSRKTATKSCMLHKLSSTFIWVEKFHFMPNTVSRIKAKAIEDSARCSLLIITPSPTKSPP